MTGREYAEAWKAWVSRSAQKWTTMQKRPGYQWPRDNAEHAPKELCPLCGERYGQHYDGNCYPRVVRRTRPLSIVQRPLDDVLHPGEKEVPRWQRLPFHNEIYAMAALEGEVVTWAYYIGRLEAIDDDDQRSELAPREAEVDHHARL